MKQVGKLARIGAAIAAIVVVLLVVRAVLYGQRLRDLVEENNRLASTAEATSTELEETGQLVGALRAHLAVTMARAQELWGDSSALDRENERLGNRLAAAQTANARLETELESRPVELPIVDDEEVLRATFHDVSVSAGDTIEAVSRLTLPLADPSRSTLATRLRASLTIDTRLVWAGGVPECQISVRHADVDARPGRCVEALGDRPIEEEAGIRLPSIGTSAAITVGLVGLGVLVGLAVGG